MKKVLLILSMLGGFQAMADSGRAHVMMHKGRVKFQFSIDSNESKGSFAVRSMLEKEGFANDNGFVATKDALAPLEIYNYLYDDGNYVFTIMLPPQDANFFVDFNLKNISFYGSAAEKLFEVVKNYGARSSYTDLEQYQWGNTGVREVNYCDKNLLTSPPEYRCRINF